MIDKIFKYTNIDYGIKIVRDSSLWFSKPENFNDPYDCYKNLIKIEPSKDGIAAYIDRNYHTTIREKEKKLNYYLRNRKILVEKIEQGIKERAENMGICCFSKTFDNLLMWSHYANNHTGVCIGFKFNYDLEVFFLYPVKYTSNFPHTDYFVNPETALLDWVLTKSEVWSYETEVRAVSFEKNGIIEIESNIVTEIYFGSKIDPMKKNEILEIISAGKLNIDVYQMRMLDDKFRLIPTANETSCIR